MKRFDEYAMTGITTEDNKAIVDAVISRNDLTIDEYGRVYDEGGIYIADAVEIENGFGVLCQ